MDYTRDTSMTYVKDSTVVTCSITTKTNTFRAVYSHCGDKVTSNIVVSNTEGSILGSIKSDANQFVTLHTAQSLLYNIRHATTAEAKAIIAQW